MKKIDYVIIIVCIISVLFFSGCPNPVNSSNQDNGIPQSQVQAVNHVDITTTPEGMTVEQENIKTRLEEDNRPGATKHLYVISAYSGQVILYSTVKGKVTSSGKRLKPLTVAAIDGEGVWSRHNGLDVTVNNEAHATAEVMQDDGTYGFSVEYIYWRDSKDIYHQHYISGGQIVHISSEPLVVKGIIINMELTNND